MSESQHITLEQIQELHERIVSNCSEMNEDHNEQRPDRARYTTRRAIEFDLDDVAVLDVALNVLIRQLGLQEKKN